MKTEEKTSILIRTIEIAILVPFLSLPLTITTNPSNNVHDGAFTADLELMLLVRNTGHVIPFRLLLYHDVLRMSDPMKCIISHTTHGYVSSDAAVNMLVRS